MKIRARDLKRGQSFLFRDARYYVIACISNKDSSVQNVVCESVGGRSLVIQLHKNFYIEASGEPKPVEILSNSHEELDTCLPFREE